MGTAQPHGLHSKFAVREVVDVVHPEVHDAPVVPDSYASTSHQQRAPSWVVGNGGSRVIAGADASLGLAVADGSSVGGRDMLTPARER
jgi:hypothetical protein